MRIFIVGPSRSGKSTAAQMFSKILNVDYAETGETVIEALAKFYALSHQRMEAMPMWKLLLKICNAEFGPELTAMGDVLTAIDPSALIEPCLKKAAIIVGVRRRCEVIAYLKSNDPLGRKTVWIKMRCDNNLLSESRYELWDCPCDFEIINEGSLTDLEEKVRRITEAIS